MRIIYWVKNGYQYWLFLVAVDIIRDKLPQMTESPFCVCIALGRCTGPRFTQPYGKSRSFGVPFLVLSVNNCTRSIRCNKTLYNISQVPVLTWPDMTSSLTSHGPRNDTTQRLFLEFVSCTVTWYKDISFQTSMKIFNDEIKLWKFALYFIACVIQEDTAIENIVMDISSSQFYWKKIL